MANSPTSSPPRADAPANVASLRTLGSGSHQAMPGDTILTGSGIGNHSVLVSINDTTPGYLFSPDYIQFKLAGLAPLTAQVSAPGGNEQFQFTIDTFSPGNRGVVGSGSDGNPSKFLNGAGNFVLINTGSSSAAAGDDTQVQFNQSGFFAGSDSFTFVDDNKLVLRSLPEGDVGLYFRDNTSAPKVNFIYAEQVDRLLLRTEGIIPIDFWFSGSRGFTFERPFSGSAPVFTITDETYSSELYHAGIILDRGVPSSDGVRPSHTIEYRAAWHDEFTSSSLEKWRTYVSTATIPFATYMNFDSYGLIAPNTGSDWHSIFKISTYGEITVSSNINSASSGYSHLEMPDGRFTAFPGPTSGKSRLYWDETEQRWHYKESFGATDRTIANLDDITGGGGGGVLNDWPNTVGALILSDSGMSSGSQPSYSPWTGIETGWSTPAFTSAPTFSITQRGGVAICTTAAGTATQQIMLNNFALSGSSESFVFAYRFRITTAMNNHYIFYFGLVNSPGTTGVVFKADGPSSTSNFLITIFGVDGSQTFDTEVPIDLNIWHTVIFTYNSLANRYSFRFDGGARVDTTATKYTTGNVNPFFNMTDSGTATGTAEIDQTLYYFDQAS